MLLHKWFEQLFSRKRLVELWNAMTLFVKVGFFKYRTFISSMGKHHSLTKVLTSLFDWKLLFLLEHFDASLSGPCAVYLSSYHVNHKHAIQAFISTWFFVAFQFLIRKIVKWSCPPTFVCNYEALFCKNKHMIYMLLVSKVVLSHLGKYGAYLGT